MRLEFIDWEIEKDHVEDYQGYEHRYCLNEIISEENLKRQARIIAQTNNFNSLLYEINKMLINNNTFEFEKNNSFRAYGTLREISRSYNRRIKKGDSNMKVITTKLKRYKVTCYIVSIILSPVRFPIYLILKLAEKLDKVMDNMTMFGYRMIEKIAKVFKFEETARKQYETNPDKFLD